MTSCCADYRWRVEQMGQHHKRVEGSTGSVAGHDAALLQGTGLTYAGGMVPVLGRKRILFKCVFLEHGRSECLPVSTCTQFWRHFGVRARSLQSGRRSQYWRASTRGVCQPDWPADPVKREPCWQQLQPCVLLPKAEAQSHRCKRAPGCMPQHVQT